MDEWISVMVQSYIRNMIFKALNMLYGNIHHQKYDKKQVTLFSIVLFTDIYDSFIICI